MRIVLGQRDQDESGCKLCFISFLIIFRELPSPGESKKKKTKKKSRRLVI